MGCILAELWTGTVLFSTHDEIEHLALMERILGTLPQRMLRNANFRRSEKSVRHGCLRWPDRAISRDSEEFVREQPRLREIIAGECKEDSDADFGPLEWSDALDDFYDMLWRLLEYHPEQRMTALRASLHRFTQSAPARQAEPPSAPLREGHSPSATGVVANGIDALSAAAAAQ